MYRSIQTTPRRHLSAGFSLMEVVISTFLVGMVVVGAMRALGSSVQANESTNQQGRAVLLADALMVEIQRADYVDSSNPVFGRELGETATDRSQHDDVDDYDSWIGQPPEQADGTPIPGLAGWKRTVKVVHLDPDDLSNVLNDSNDQGVKRIRVTVRRNGEFLARLNAIVTGTSITYINPIEEGAPLTLP